VIYRLRRLWSSITYAAYSLPARTRAWVSIRLRQQNAHLQIRKADGSLGGNIAIVVAFPRAPLIPSIHRLLRALDDNGFTVILVVNETRDADECLADWEGSAAHVLVRPNIGRDFGGYQAGTRYLLEHADMSQTRRVAYFNDSVFYPLQVASPLRDWLGGPDETSALYLNLEARPHLQSFAFYVAGSALLEPNSNAFWRNYYPSDQRMYAIRKGELGLSKALLKDGSMLGSFLSWHRLDAALDGDWQSLQSAEIQALSSMAGPTIDPYMKSVIKRAGKSNDSLKYAELAKVFLTTRNSSASLGPLATRVLGLPLKLDLVKSGFLTLADFEATLLAAGTDSREVGAIMTLVKTSGSIASAVGFRRLWRDFGHY
jgi:hypothetical protein